MIGTKCLRLTPVKRRVTRIRCGMISASIKGGKDVALRVLTRTKLFSLAESLGGVESLVVLPIYTSHYNMSLAELRAASVEPGTVRVSVGLEDPEDLIEDLRQALA